MEAHGPLGPRRVAISPRVDMAHHLRKVGTMQIKTCKALILTGLVVLILAACGSATPASETGTEVGTLEAASLAPGERLRVVATTNIVGDVARNVGGETVDLTVLMAPGVDPHSYVPTADDTRAIHDAHLVLANGAGLEANLDEMLKNAGGKALHVQLSEGLELLQLSGETVQGDAGSHGDADPHVWFSVPNVIHWVGTISDALSALDPDNAPIYGENAQAYVVELEALDAWIQQQVNGIPPANRRLVTNHPAFGYLANRYGLEQVGAVYPISPSAEPSARDISALQDVIREYGVPAIFTESTANPQLAEQVARDTGVKLVPLYTGSLSAPGGGAESYLELMRTDVRAIVEALR
jgi:manganese/iron transport system substrate-binding protein